VCQDESVEICFPLEWIVEGVPISQQAQNKEPWKQAVRAAVKDLLPQNHFLTEAPLHVTIFYFPDADMEGDLDNIVKPILDALIGIVYVDDSQIDRLLVQRFEPGRLQAFEAPTASLAEAAVREGPRVYIRLDAPIRQENRRG
jgi:hypothetical protein